MSHIPRHIEVIYCDDIREEVGHKVSYMGVYSKELSVNVVPVLLAKLCIAVKVVTEITDPFLSLEVRILKGDDEVELLTTGTIPAPTDMSIFENGGTVIIAQLVFILAPFQIDGDTKIRVVATTEREELRGAGLRIRVTPPQTSEFPISQ